MRHRIPKPRKLTPGEVDRVRHGGFARDCELEDLAGPEWEDGTEYPSEIYVLPEGKVAWCWGENGEEHSSYCDVAELIRAAAAGGPGRHVLEPYELITGGFPSQVIWLAKLLFSQLLMPGEPTFSGEEFEEVMRRVAKGEATEFLDAGRFELLLAYYGEFARRESGGTWEMHYKDGVWEPYVIMGTRKRSVFMELFDCLDEGCLTAEDGGHVGRPQ